MFNKSSFLKKGVMIAAMAASLGFATSAYAGVVKTVNYNGKTYEIYTGENGRDLYFRGTDGVLKGVPMKGTTYVNGQFCDIMSNPISESQVMQNFYRSHKEWNGF